MSKTKPMRIQPTFKSLSKGLELAYRGNAMNENRAVRRIQKVMTNEEKFKDSIDKAKVIASKMPDRVVATAFLKSVDYLVSIGDSQTPWFVESRQIALNNIGKTTQKVKDNDSYSF